MKSCLAPILAAALVISLAGCKEDAVDTAAYEPTSEHCQPDYLKTLPDNKAREDLVARLEPEIAKAYDQVAHTAADVTVSYQRSWTGPLADAIAATV